MRQPTNEEIERVAAMCADPLVRAHFFGELRNPLWVKPLDEHLFFTDPPGPERDSAEGHIRFPIWPEGGFLARMAGDVPSEVLDILRRVPINENPRVTEAVLLAANGLPDEDFRTSAPLLLEWLAQPWLEYFTTEAQSVVGRMFDLGVERVGLRALGALLEVHLVVRPPDQQTETFHSPREFAGRVSDWEYEQLIEGLVPRAVQASGMKVISLLQNILRQALRDPAAPEKDDLSIIWRPAIEDHAQNKDRDVLSHVVSALRDAVVAFHQTSPEELDNLLRGLERGTGVERRTALHLLASIEDGTSQAEARIVDPSTREDSTLRHEYAELLRHRFGDVSKEAQAVFISWVHGGPDVEEHRARWIARDGEEPSDEEIDGFVESWRRDRLSYIVDHLGQEDLDAYNGLVARLGQPEHPDFGFWMSGGSYGTTSPFSTEELLVLPAEDLVQKLASWVPDGIRQWPPGPTIEGLGDVLQTVVEQRAAEIAPAAPQFAELDPTYVREVFSGLRAAVSAGVAIDWTGPLRLAELVLSRPFDPEVVVSDRDRDPHWGWCRREISAFLKAGLEVQGSGPPPDQAASVWARIERLADDPNPDPQQEAEFGGNNMDPYTLSLNTNRGAAMNTAVEFALWLHRSAEGHVGDGSMTDYAERLGPVLSTLERHLNPEVDPAPSVRSVYGRWYPWLALIDDEWAGRNAGTVFENLGESGLGQVAWDSYISWCPAYDSMRELLGPQYRQAIISSPSGRRSGSFERESVDEKLGEHLMVFYWRGLDEGEIGDLLDRCGDGTAAHIVSFAGSVLRSDGDLSAGLLDRLRIYWSARRAVIEGDPAAHPVEAQAFCDWFASDRFDRVWALNQLEWCVKVGGAPAVSHWVVKFLEEAASDEPLVAVTVLRNMVRSVGAGWELHAWREGAAKVVRTAIGTLDAPTTAVAREVADAFVKAGLLEFRQVVDSKNS